MEKETIFKEDNIKKSIGIPVSIGLGNCTIILIDISVSLKYHHFPFGISQDQIVLVGMDEADDSTTAALG